LANIGKAAKVFKTYLEFVNIFDENCDETSFTQKKKI